MSAKSLMCCALLQVVPQGSSLPSHQWSLGRRILLVVLLQLPAQLVYMHLLLLH